MIAVLRAALGAVFQDVNGVPSSKRAGFLIGIALLGASWVANVFWKVQIDPNIMGTIAGLLGITSVSIAAERFGK